MNHSEPHVPVLKREALDALQLRSDGTYLDLTLGRCGHAQGIVERLGVKGRLIGFDRDAAAIEYAKRIFAGDDRVTIIHSEFANLQRALDRSGTAKTIDGVLLDLGVSSPQLDEARRGFSFMRDGELDMRMNNSTGDTAAQWLARVEEGQLVQVLFDYGEEKFARRIANAIVTERAERSITTTGRLAAIVENAIPRKEKHKHPATRTFQAIRIHINQELEQIRLVLPQAVQQLNEGGRLVVISFHSLEDRIVKRFLRDYSTPKLPPRRIPVDETAYQVPLRLISKAIKPSQNEIDANPRARSSVMRIAERTSVPFVNKAGGNYAN